MPNSIIKSFAKKSGKSVQEVEKIWNEIKEKLIKQNYDDKNKELFYKILVTILKKKLKIEDED